MSQMSDYLENKLIDHVFRNTAYSVPTTVYIGLFTVTPSDTGGGTEVSGGNYARVQVGPSTTAWNGTHGNTTGASSGTGGQTSNAATITFPAPSASWGSIVAIGIFDASTGGNLLLWGPLTTAKTVNNGDPAPTFPATTLTVTFA